MNRLSTRLSKRHQPGLSLVELMIAMTLGILIVGGMAVLFVQNKNSYAQDERITRMQEDARFALNEIVSDVELAAFWSNLLDPASIVQDDELSLTQDCDAGAAAMWVYDPDQGVSAYDKPDNANSIDTVFGCIDAADYQANTDAIAIKRVEGIAMEDKDDPTLVDEEVYLRTNGVLGLLFENHNTGFTPDVTVPAPVEHWRYMPRVYYVRNFATTAGDGIPTLCRYYLDYSAATPTMAEECLARGVENLQIEYGIDTDTDGVANQYLSNPTAAQLQSQLVSVRVHLLMRSVEPDPGYTNTKTYTIGNTVYDPNPDDNFYRRVYTTTVLVRNTRNLRCVTVGCN